MKLSRRDLGFLLPALAGAAAVTQETQLQTLPSKVYRNDQIPYGGNEQKKSRKFFNGLTHAGFNLEMHETILGPGVQSHPPHKHVHEEIMTVLEGTVEAYVEGKTEAAPAGSVIYFASNQMHKVRNGGTTPCRYYVVELRGNDA